LSLIESSWIESNGSSNEDAGGKFEGGEIEKEGSDDRLSARVDLEPPLVESGGGGGGGGGERAVSENGTATRGFERKLSQAGHPSANQIQPFDSFSWRGLGGGQIINPNFLWRISQDSHNSSLASPSSAPLSQECIEIKRFLLFFSFFSIFFY